MATKFDAKAFELEYLKFINELKKKSEHVTENTCQEQNDYVETDITDENESENLVVQESTATIKNVSKNKIKIQSPKDESDETENSTQNQLTFKSFIRGKRVFIDRERR